MTPQPKPGDYVRAVQINGTLQGLKDSYTMRVGRLKHFWEVTDGDRPELGDYFVSFGDGSEFLILEIEPATKADYDADWPEEEPAMPEPHCSECHKPSLSVICDECVSKAVGNIVGYPTASAVLTAGNFTNVTIQRMYARAKADQFRANEALVAANKECAALEEVMAARGVVIC